MRRTLAAALLVFFAAMPLAGQGRTDRPNFEEIQVKPITVARVDGFDFLLVCNTPDDSLEIYSTRTHKLLFRQPTGQGPVSVVYDSARKRAYVAAFLGDSITIVHLAASGTESIQVTFDQTTWVGDEPWHLVLYTIPGNEETAPRHTLLVSHQTLDTIGWLDANTLQPIAPGFLGFHAETPFDLDGDGQPDGKLALKEPRTLAVLGDQLIAIATKGGNSTYDNDVWCSDLATTATRQHGGLGSSNTNLAFDSSGNLYVVGGLARNGELQGEAAVASALTGFVKSMFFFVKNVCTDNIQIDARDLNATPNVVAQNPVTGLMEAAGVAKKAALTQPMDVALLEGDGGVSKIYVAAFGIDRVGVLKPNFSQPVSAWPLARIPIKPLTNPMAGPRGLAIKSSNPALEGDRARVYVLNRLDNSVSVIDPATDTVIDTFPLANDPRPKYVRAGQEFLFGAQHSGNQMSSCASCHIDARTDRLAWNLGSNDPAVQIPDTLKDNIGFVPDWPSQKGIMVTQSMQGLINFEVDPEAQRMFTNAPYHWRGDRNDFEDFNPAFVSLLGAASQLSAADMASYKTYVFSILYPGNPKQPLERVYSGSFGPSSQANNQTVGTGALHGMKLFHLDNADGRSCSHCHALPDGSNNLLTEGATNPIEVATLRHLFQREGRVDKGRTTLPSDAPFSGLTGLVHTGGVGSGSPFDVPPFNELDLNPVLSLDAFNRFFFSAAFCPTYGSFCSDLQDVNSFLHEFDTGVSSLVGLPVTFDVGSDPTFVQSIFDLMEGQANRANVGVAAHVFTGSGIVGFAFDPPSSRYQQVPSGFALTRAGLLALLAASTDRLVVQATPLGAQRRIASPTGVAPAQLAVAPAAITMLPWRPNTAYEKVPLMSTFWATFSDPTSFYTHTVRLFQRGILQDAGAPPLNGLGLTGLRHEAPRRVVIAGRRIQPGARVHLFVPNDPAGPPDLTKAPEAAGQIATLRVALPLYATNEVSAAGLPVFQTGVEWAPLMLYKTMLGGDFAPGIQPVLNDVIPFTIPEPPPLGTFDPVNWGFVYVRVVNPGGLAADAGWQRIVLSPP